MKHKGQKKGIALLEAVLSLALIGLLLLPIFLLNSQANLDLRTAYETEQLDTVLRSALEEFYAISAPAKIEQIRRFADRALTEKQIIAVTEFSKKWQILQESASGDLLTLRLTVSRIGGDQRNAETSIDFFYSP